MTTSKIRLSLAMMHAVGDARRGNLLRDIESRLHADGAPWSYGTILDDCGEGVWPTARRAWSAIPTRATHHLVLQDDMVPCLGFLEALTSGPRAAPNALVNPPILALVPDRPVSLFSPCAISYACKAIGVAWHTSLDGAWGGSIILPADLARAFVPWCDENLLEEGPGARALGDQDDARLALFLLARGIPILHASPGLLRHAGVGLSTCGNDRGSQDHRHGQWILGDEGDARDVDWTRGLEKPLDIGLAWDHRGLLWTAMRPERRKEVDWERLKKIASARTSPRQ